MTDTSRPTPAPAADPAYAEPPRQASKAAWALIVGMALLLIAGGVVLAWSLAGSSTPKGKDWFFEVPAGTYDKIARGQKVVIMPGRLEIRKGDQLIITNNDNQPVAVGPFGVRAGETFRHRFKEAGRYVGICEIGEGGQVEIVVT